MPPVARWRLEDLAQGLLGGGVEGGGRFVEEPERPVGDEQPGERHPAALPGREIGHGQARGMGEAHRVERLARGERRVSEEVAGEGEVFFRRERRFEGIPVPDIVQAFGQGPLAGILEADRPRFRVQAARQDVEQGGFAGAVAAGDHQGLAGRKGE